MSHARTVLCGGCRVTGIPTATASIPLRKFSLSHADSSVVDSGLAKAAAAVFLRRTDSRIAHQSADGRADKAYADTLTLFPKVENPGERSWLEGRLKLLPLKRMNKEKMKRHHEELQRRILELI